MEFRNTFLVGVLLALFTSCNEKNLPLAVTDQTLAMANVPVVAKVEVPPAYLAQLKALPAVAESGANELTEDKISLGRMLYFDKRFSKNHDISCNSCHDLNKFGVDNQQFSPGHKKQLGGRNSPSVYNAAFHVAQFWDGRASDVEEQAKGPVLNPVEMAMVDENAVLKVINSIPEYVEAFKKAFPGDNPVTYDNFGKAIGAFERKLVTPSRFDKFIGGDETALTDTEKNGLIKFMETGCYSCHNGPTFGGNMFMKIGLVKPWPGIKDKGRSVVTKNASDDYVFKVPSLRNIEKTAPYLHDGSEKDLRILIGSMAEYQLGKVLSAAEIESIEAFLKSLTGKPESDYIKEPILPASSATTPVATPE